MLLTLLLATLASAETPALRCKAIYRSLDENQQGIEQSTPLKVAFQGAGATRYEAELKGRFFSVLADSSDLLVQITTAPDYTKGSVTKGRLDSKGHYSLSEVDGSTAHRLECRQSDNR